MLKVYLVYSSIFAVFLHKHAGDAEPTIYLVETQGRHKSVQDTFEADLPNIQGGDVELEKSRNSLGQSGF